MAPALSALLLDALSPAPQGRSDAAPRRVLRRWHWSPPAARAPKAVVLGHDAADEPRRLFTARLLPSIGMYDTVICCPHIFFLGWFINMF